MFQLAQKISPEQDELWDRPTRELLTITSLLTYWTRLVSVKRHMRKNVRGEGGGSDDAVAAGDSGGGLDVVDEIRRGREDGWRRDQRCEWPGEIVPVGENRDDGRRETGLLISVLEDSRCDSR